MTTEKHARMQVTKKAGYLQVLLVDRGTLTDDQVDTVMQHAIKQFSNFSKFQDPPETRAVRVLYDHEPGCPEWVEFDREIDFEPVDNRVVSQVDAVLATAPNHPDR